MVIYSGTSSGGINLKVWQTRAYTAWSLRCISRLI